MASSLMHLAICEGLTSGVARPDLFRLGAVLPDAAGQAGHYRSLSADGRLKFYDLDRFRRDFPGLARWDDFALGYYMHLVQDMLYRGFVYLEHHWNPAIPGNVHHLHDDYRRLNPLLVGWYNLRCELILPSGWIHPLLSPGAEAFLANLRQDFRPAELRTDAYFLTWNMAKEFIDRAMLICKDELTALRRGETTLNPMAYAYPAAARIREVHPEEYPLMDTFLYEAIFTRKGEGRPPRNITARPELAIYVKDFGARRGDHALCALVDGRIAGMVWTRIIPGYGHLDDETPEFAISVLPDYRGRSLGSQLMLTMVKLLRDAGYARASLAVQKDNFALKMYQKAGFSIVGETAEEYLMRIDLK